MAANKQAVFLQRENDKGVQQLWQGGWVEVDSMAGTVTVSPRGILGGKWTISVRPNLLTNFQIAMVSDINSLGMMYGGGLIGYGIAAVMSRWVKMPSLKFEQANAEMGQRTVALRSVGFQPRKKTRQLANQIADLLAQHGYKGMKPDLIDDAAWKYPIMPVLIGLGLLVLVVVGVCVCLVILNPGTGTGQ
jgi:hypothetical protein